MSEPSYDDYLAEQAEQYMKECYCEPEVIKVEKQFEFRNEDGSIETSDDKTYNCSICNKTECEYYEEYH